MTGRPHAPARATASLLAAMTALQATAAGQEAPAAIATDQRCAKGADVRRIEIRFADRDGGLPCKVIYRPEADSDTLGIVSWQNIDELAACEAQATEVIERLTEEGWTCAADSGASSAELARLVEQVSDDDGDAPAAEPGTAADPDQPADGAVATATGQADADGQDGGTEPVDAPAVLVDSPDLPPPPEDLAALITRDLERLDITLDGVLEARIAGYGDLNADDVDDALVLYTYSSPQPAYRQFLAAYVFDGGSYQLTATRPVGGTINATRDAAVETIDQGVVHLTLKAFEPGDPSCCPSGTRRLALGLRDLDLVEIDASLPIR